MYISQDIGYVRNVYEWKSIKVQCIGENTTIQLIIVRLDIVSSQRLKMIQNDSFFWYLNK